MDEFASAREVDRRFAEMAQRVDGVDSRVTRLAQDAVMTTVWSEANSHVRTLISNVEAQSKERHSEVMAALSEMKKNITQRSEFTWQRVIGLLSAIALLGGLLFEAVNLGRGIK